MSERIRYGADYNPEQWPRDVWDEDVRLMMEAGVDLVTVGCLVGAVGAGRGQLCLRLAAGRLDLLSRAGIGVDLATPTAAPPALHSRTTPVCFRSIGRVSATATAAGRAFVLQPHLPREGARLFFFVSPGGRARRPRAIEMSHVHNDRRCESLIAIAIIMRGPSGNGLSSATVRWTRSTRPGARCFGARPTQISTKSCHRA